MHLAVFSDAGGADPLQEGFIVQLFPDMAGTGSLHLLPVIPEAVQVKNAGIHFLEKPHILGLHGSVPHHRLVFLSGAFIVALAVSPVGI